MLIGPIFFTILMIIWKIINLICVYNQPLLWLIVLWGEGLRFEEASSKLTDALVLWFHTVQLQPCLSLQSAALSAVLTCLCCLGAPAGVIWKFYLWNKSRGIFFLSLNLVFRAVTISTMMSIYLSCKSSPLPETSQALWWLFMGLEVSHNSSSGQLALVLHKFCGAFCLLICKKISIM